MGDRVTKKITFFTPTMKRTGSEIVLLNLINKINPSYSVKLYSKYKGELLGKIKTSQKVDYLYKNASSSFFRRIINKLKKELITPYKLANQKKSVWYINTIVLPELLDYAKKSNIKTIVHIHELEQMFDAMTQYQIETLIQYPKLLIANSEASQQVLIKFGRTENIKICYPAIDTSSIVKNKIVYTNFRKKLNIPENNFVWIMCGTLDENKNPFLFIDIAFEISKTHPNAFFIWIGSDPLKSFEDLCKQKTSEKNLSNKIRWITNPENDYLNYLNCADGFVLTSKMESFSLVTLEALLLELPIVANNCEGVKEILKNDIGKIVEEKNNAKKMSQEMIKYMDNIYLLDIEKGKQRAKEFDIKIWSKKWNEILNDFFEDGIS